METVSIPIQLSNYEKLSPFDFLLVAKHILNAHIFSILPNLNLQSFLIKHAYNLPPLGIGAAVLNNSSKISVFALFNGIAYHTPSLSLLFVSNSLFKNKPGIFLTFFYFTVKFLLLK